MTLELVEKMCSSKCPLFPSVVKLGLRVSPLPKWIKAEKVLSDLASLLECASLTTQERIRGLAYHQETDAGVESALL